MDLEVKDIVYLSEQVDSSLAVLYKKQQQAWDNLHVNEALSIAQTKEGFVYLEVGQDDSWDLTDGQYQFSVREPMVAVGPSSQFYRLRYRYDIDTYYLYLTTACDVETDPYVITVGLVLTSPGVGSVAGVKLCYGTGAYFAKGNTNAGNKQALLDMKDSLRYLNEMLLDDYGLYEVHSEVSKVIVPTDFESEWDI